MAERYWVGDSGNWNDTAKWSTSSGGSGGASVPGTGDNANIDANSLAASSIVTINVTASVTDLIITGLDNTLTLTLSADLTCSGTFQSNSNNNATGRTLIQSNSLGTSRTITAATVAITGADFKDITGAGAGSWDISGATGGSGDCGGNTDITFTTADDWYWNGSGTRDFSDYTYWYTATNGGGSQMGSTRVPLPQDTCYFNADSIDGATTIVNDMPRICKTLDWTGCGSVTWDCGNAPSTPVLYGSLILSNNVTWTVAGTVANNMTFEGRGAFTLNLSGKAFAHSTVRMIGGSLTCNADFTGGSNRRHKVEYGTFDLNGYNWTTATLSSSNTNTRSVIMGSGTWTISGGAAVCWDIGTATNMTLTCGTSTIVFNSGSATTRSFKGGGQTYHAITFNTGAGPTSRNYLLTGSNTFGGTFTIGEPNSVSFTAGTTQTVADLVATGTSGNEITIQSSSAGSKWTITKTGGGTVEEDYLNVTDSEGTPATTWYYGANGSGDAYSQANGWAATSSASITVTPSVISLHGNAQSPTIRTNVSIATNLISNYIRLQAITAIRTNAIVSTNVISAKIEVQTPTVRVEAIVETETIDISIDILSSTIKIDCLISPDVALNSFGVLTSAIRIDYISELNSIANRLLPLSPTVITELTTALNLLQARLALHAPDIDITVAVTGVADVILKLSKIEKTITRSSQMNKFITKDSEIEQLIKRESKLH